jgi:hypothetical protein
MIPNIIMQIMNMNPRMRQAMQNMQNINSPDSMAQYLLNSGVVSQDQVNKARQMWGQPNVKQMVQNKFNI